MTDRPLRSIVTGAAGGIGAAVAGALAARGDRVVGLDLADGDGRIRILHCDLAVADDRRAAVEDAVTSLGGVDVLVNCAGVYRAGGVLDSALPQWRGVWAVDLEAPLELMGIVGGHMAAQRFGRIVNITSVHAAAGAPASVAYDVGKAGLEAGTRSAAIDLAARGVLVNAVAPGFVRTAMSVLPDGRDETDTAQFQGRYVASGRLPLGRAAAADEIAPAVAFLCSRDNTYVTGSVVTVDGGLLATF